jgi:DNA-binding response OmpR family regulator
MDFKVLVVDDDINVLSLLKEYLENTGFKVFAANNGDKAIEIFKMEKLDIVILDVMLPNKDGFEIVKEMRQNSNIPIIMLTARVEEVDKIMGFELGIDDYVTKPFSPKELVVRIKAILRRTQELTPQNNTLTSEHLSLNDLSHTVTLQEKEISLTRTEFDILEILMKNPEQVLTREILTEKILGYAYDTSDRTMNVHIKNLRQKIEEDSSNPKFILTVYGIGYKFGQTVI